MNPCWIGLDAGGTGSTVVVLDHNLKELHRLKGGPIQARKMTLPDQMSVVATYIHSIKEIAPAITIGGFGLGIAGAGRAEERTIILDELNTLWPDIPFVVAPDSEAAHIGAFAGNDGILVITGTGSIVWGKHDGTWMRAGGFGYLIGDEGSGMKLGMEGFAAVGHAWDGGKPTILCDMLSKEHGIANQSDIIRMIYDQQFQPSKIAINVLKAASDGDEVCHDIVKRQTSLLASQVGLIGSRFKTKSIPIVLWGGLQKNDYYQHQLQNAIRTRLEAAQFVDPQFEPCTGAALMARSAFALQQ
jgi:N-acetylglucosamine kinase-like BadF-type ATPase